MFNNKKVESLEQSVATLTEGLDKANNTIDTLLDNIEELVEKLNNVQYEKNKFEDKYNDLEEQLKNVCENYSELENKYNDFVNAFKNSYATRIDRTFEEMTAKSDKDRSALREEIRKVTEIIDELKRKSDKADEKHSTQIEALTKSTDALVKKCEDIQLSNVQIMNQHNDMIKRYEESIKGYAEQTQVMKDNILKKMNISNVINVVEE